MSTARRIASISSAAAALLLALPLGAQAFDPTVDRETHLLSRAYDGGFPDGPSRNGAFAQNGQGASFAAFESDATDIVPGDSNGVTDVFVVRRGGSFTQDRGEPWQPAGAAELVSRGLGGAPANGPSRLPDFDGSALHRSPHCVAFVSDASNLVPNDFNGKADAFIKDLNSGAISRVSLGPGGVESNGATYDVKVDGACSRVAFTSDASNLYLSRRRAGRNKQLRPLYTRAPLAGTKQVYVRFLNNRKDNQGLRNITFLASASKRRRPGAGNSYDVTLGRLGDGCPKRCGTTSGDSVAFTSDAQNLTRGDSNGQPDIYQRTFYLPKLTYKIRRAGKKRKLKLRTKLISSNASGRAGNGASTNAASNDDGEFVAFETTATDLVPGGDQNGHTSDILLRGTFKGSRRMRLVSHALETGQANGASHNVTITSPASIHFFESDASNLQPNPPREAGIFYDRNCTRDIFFWNTVSGNASLQSRGSDHRIPNLPENTGGRTTDPCPPVASEGATNPVTSYYGNYFLFESSYPLFEFELVRRALPVLLDWGTAARRSQNDPKLHQVYLRYNGPKDADATFPPSDWPMPEQPGGGDGPPPPLPQL